MRVASMNKFQKLGFILSAPLLITVLTTLIYSLIGGAIRLCGRARGVVLALAFGAGLATATISVFASFVLARLAAYVHVEGLDGASPGVTDHAAQAAGVGALAINAADTTAYHWSQVGWSAGLASTFVRRLQTVDLSQIDI